MKNYLFIICIALIFACKDNPSAEGLDKNTNEVNSEVNTLEGAWQLVSYYNYRENELVDTILTSNINKQVKMYSPTKVMWSRMRISDSLDWFAYGDYTVENGFLSEFLDYGSKSMNKVIKEKNEFVFKINIEKDNFSQIRIDSLGNPIYAENYLRIE